MFCGGKYSRKGYFRCYGGPIDTDVRRVVDTLRQKRSSDCERIKTLETLVAELQVEVLALRKGVQSRRSCESVGKDVSQGVNDALGHVDYLVV
jgi:hypothetical protein